MTSKFYTADSIVQSTLAAGSTSNPNTTSASYADIPEMTCTLITTGGDLIAAIDGCFYVNAGGIDTFLAFSLDGAAEVHIRDMNLGGSVSTLLSMSHRFANVAAGSHTVTARWRVSPGTVNTLTAFGAFRDMTLVELKR